VHLLDIEGTTTPISFVADTLFPLARAGVATFIAAHRDRPDVVQILTELRLAWDAEEEHAARQPRAWPPDSRSAAGEYAVWLMRQDRKLTPLKMLQGLIWEQSYYDGRLVAPVYEDVKPALERWAARGCRAAIYSSGSVLAQRLLFRHTTVGDLTPLLGSLFDTTVGSKHDAASYSVIASSLQRDPCDVRFVSDCVDELDAARFAGLNTALCVREEAFPEDSGGHPIVQSLAELEPGP
jgi:enolase-phosphatase E1